MRENLKNEKSHNLYKNLYLRKNFSDTQKYLANRSTLNQWLAIFITSRRYSCNLYSFVPSLRPLRAAKHWTLQRYQKQILAASSVLFLLNAIWSILFFYILLSIRNFTIAM